MGEPFLVFENGRELASLRVDDEGRLVIEMRKAGKLKLGAQDARRLAGEIVERSFEHATKQATLNVKRGIRDEVTRALGLGDDEDT